MTLYRSDQWLSDALGNAIAGASVAFCSQPAMTNPPSPLIALYADSAGATAIPNPLTTDGLGHAFAYMNPGVYTIIFTSARTQQVILTDQTVVAPFTGAETTWMNDNSSNGSIIGDINGSNVTFAISTTPVPPESLIFTINGVIQPIVSTSGQNITLAYAPHTGNLLNAIYQTS